ncbi:transposase [Methylohalomonas lacus]|uniref:Transposase n=2 Tax=Methylohalomonas lacus TaxID=398773 RepID=A0AAE3HPC9_9GAMM|nr:transposase [Methylohalomonas lacus]
MIVGIDISKTSFDVAWLEAGRQRHQTLVYTAAGFAELLALTPAGSHYVMEATGVYHSRLAVWLYEAGRSLTVLNPLVVKRFAQMQLSRVKSDKADAELLRRYGEQHVLTPWQPESDEVVALQQAHGWLDDLVRARTQLLNRQEAAAHQPQPSAFVAGQMAAQLQQLEQQIEDCEQHLAALVKKSFSALYARLLSIPSVGPRTAMELIIVTAGFSRFTDVKALGAYIGVTPTTYRSGTSVRGQGGIAKLGQGRMRQLLYLCSWTAKSCNPACRALYDRLKAAGKPARVINIAIAHKLLRQAFAVATTNRPYSAEYA